MLFSNAAALSDLVIFVKFKIKIMSSNIREIKKISPESINSDGTVCKIS